MRQRCVTACIISVALLSGGCFAADPFPGEPRERAPESVAEPLGLPPQTSPEPASATPRGAVPSPEPKDRKRGNTPPGTDRSGGGPASGAILDPAGAVTREPVLRER